MQTLQRYRKAKIWCKARKARCPAYRLMNFPLPKSRQWARSFFTKVSVSTMKWQLPRWPGPTAWILPERYQGNLIDDSRIAFWKTIRHILAASCLPRRQRTVDTCGLKVPEFVGCMRKLRAVPAHTIAWTWTAETSERSSRQASLGPQILLGPGCENGFDYRSRQSRAAKWRRRSKPRKRRRWNEEIHHQSPESFENEALRIRVYGYKCEYPLADACGRSGLGVFTQHAQTHAWFATLGPLFNS